MTKGLLKKFEAILNDPFFNSDNAINEIKALIEVETIKQPATRPTELAAELVSKQTERLSKPVQTPQFYRTGFENFDSLHNGLCAGELIILGGRPGMGKTSIMVSMAIKMSYYNPLTFISMDDSAETITSRIISSMSGVAPNKIRDHKLSDEELAKINKSKNELVSHLLYINDTMFGHISQLSDYIREQATENKIKIFFIDYLQLLNNTKHRNYNRDQEIGIIMRELKSLCKELNVTILVSSQLSRNVELRGGDKRPFLSDLRDSGSIEQDADKVMFLYRPDYYIWQENNSEVDKLIYLIMAKNRNGGTGDVVLSYNTYLTRFEPAIDDEQHFEIKKSFKDGLTNIPW